MQTVKTSNMFNKLQGNNNVFISDGTQSKHLKSIHNKAILKVAINLAHFMHSKQQF